AAKGLGLSYYGMEKFSYAAKALKMPYIADPHQEETAYILDWSILRGWEINDAKNYFKQSLKEYPLRASLYMGMGWIHYREGNPNLAVEFFLKAISLDPEFALSEEFKEVLKNERFGWQVHNRLGWTYYAKKDYQKSMEMFRISLKHQPNKSEARKGIGYILFKMGKNQMAARFLDECLRINPDPNPVIEESNGQEEAVAPYKLETTARTKLGRIYLLLNNPQEALVQFIQELELRPEQPDAL
ncbi:uncharacterized protein METZ01_LOCUS480103, partial [marine metagenome]